MKGTVGERAGLPRTLRPATWRALGPGLRPARSRGPWRAPSRALWRGLWRGLRPGPQAGAWCSGARADQLSTSSMPVHGRPWASATGP